jgi:peroxiredoxin
MLSNRLRIAAALVAVAALALPATGVAGPEHDHGKKAHAAIDKPAPDFELKGIDGKAYKLSDFKGKYVVLEWNNFDCPFVKKHYASGNMPALQKKYTDEGVVWLTICSSAEGKQGYYPASDMKTQAADRKRAGTAYLMDSDGTVGRMYEAKTTPHMYLINPDGVLVYAGAIDDKPTTSQDDVKGAHNYVAASIDAAMAGKAVPEKTTSSYGCSVKYAN